MFIMSYRISQRLSPSCLPWNSWILLSSCLSFIHASLLDVTAVDFFGSILVSFWSKFRSLRKHVLCPHNPCVSLPSYPTQLSLAVVSPRFLTLSIWQTLASIFSSRSVSNISISVSIISPLYCIGNKRFLNFEFLLERALVSTEICCRVFSLCANFYLSCQYCCIWLR